MTIPPFTSDDYISYLKNSVFSLDYLSITSVFVSDHSHYSGYSLTLNVNEVTNGHSEVVLVSFNASLPSWWDPSCLNMALGATLEFVSISMSGNLTDWLNVVVGLCIGIGAMGGWSFSNNEFEFMTKLELGVRILGKVIVNLGYTFQEF